MKSAGLTLTIVVEGQNLNYGESLANISSLKKIQLGNKLYTYMSKQALKYELRKSISNYLGQESAPVSSDTKDKAVVQFSEDATIDKYAEVALFGYMRTEAQKNGVHRSAVARVTDAISLESYHNNIDFLTNQRMASLADKFNNIAQTENHKSLYAYTISVDLDALLVDDNYETKIDSNLGYSYIDALLSSVENLSRSIKGGTSNLHPLFLIGTISEIKSPFFEDSIKYDEEKETINVDRIKDYLDNSAILNPHIGYVSGTFANEKQLKDALSLDSVGNVFSKLKKEVKEYYEGN